MIQTGSMTNMRLERAQQGFELHKKTSKWILAKGIFLTQRLTLNGKTQGRLL
jgi:hypothetical protein